MGIFAQNLSAAVRRCGNPVCVGLDPRPDQLPRTVVERAQPLARSKLAGAYALFCQEILDVVAGRVGVVKPQAACFEEQGPPGMLALGEVIAAARQRGLIVVLDGKRNDIGSTATAYAAGYLGRESPWGADALTVNPYLGEDSVRPFVEHAGQVGAGVFVLVKTSNLGGGMFQDLEVSGRPLFEHVADFVNRLARETSGDDPYGDVGAVVGATWPDQVSHLRALMPKAWFLVPGFGSQGGMAEDVAGAFDQRGEGAIINSSRQIIFAHARREYAGRFAPSDWTRAVELATAEMIDQLREHTLAGRLEGGYRG